MPCPSLAVAALLAAGLPAAEVLRHEDGRRESGALSLAGGRLHFTPAGGVAAPLSGGLVDFAPATPAPLRVGAAHRVLLRGGQRLTGQLLGLDAETLRLRTAWAEQADVPRAAVVAVTHPAGLRTVWADDFAAWAAEGMPARRGAEVVLDRAGQTLTRAFETGPREGRVVAFFEARDAAGGRWALEAGFGEARLRLVIGRDGYAAEAQGVGGGGTPARPSPGWHRAEIRFGPHAVAVLVDEAVVWSDLDRGVAGPLTRLHLTCAGDAVGGAVAWSEVAVGEAAPDSPRLPGDPAQDEVWRADGDQLFGRVVTADRRSVDFDGPGGRRSLPWAGLRGLWLADAAPPPRASDGAHVRLWLRPGAGGEPDELEGLVTGLDERRLTLRHPLLGELSLPRERLLRLRSRYFGRRVEIDNGARPLGDCEWRCRLDAVPAAARLTLDVEAPRGGRVEVLVNGRPAGVIEGRGRRREAVALTARDLQTGDNVLRLRLVADAGPPVTVSGLALEAPR
jgi:hypothetical protein